MAREEFAYFELESFPGLVEYFKTLRAPISPEDAALVYMVNAIADKTYISMLRSGTVEPGVTDTYHEFEQWFYNNAPANYMSYQERLHSMLNQIKVIPDLLMDYIGGNYNNIGQAQELQKVVLSSILPTLSVLQSYKTDEARSALQIANSIQRLNIDKPIDVQQLEQLLTDLYDTTWAFFINIYRVYAPPVSDYAQNVGTLVKLENVNPAILEPNTVHLTDKEFANIFNYLFSIDNMWKNQDRQITEIESLFTAVINTKKIDRNMMKDLQEQMRTNPTLLGMIMYNLLLKPLQEGSLLGDSKDRKSNIVDAVSDFIINKYETHADKYLKKLQQISNCKNDEEFCQNIFKLVYDLFKDTVKVQNNKIVFEPLYAHTLINQISAFIGFISRSNDIIWITPEITQNGDEKKSIGISKDRMFEELHKLGLQIPQVTNFLNNYESADKFVDSLFSKSMKKGSKSQQTQHINELKIELEEDRSIPANKIKTELKENLKKYNNQELSKEQQLVLAVSDVYVKYKDKYEADKTDIEAEKIMNFTKCIVEPCVLVGLFFELYKQDKDIAYNILENKKLDSEYLDRMAATAPTKNYTQTLGYYVQYAGLYSLQTTCAYLNMIFPNFNVSIYSDPKPTANNSGLDFKVVLCDRHDPKKEIIMVYSIDSKCDTNSTPENGSALSNIEKSLGMAISINPDKWDDLSVKIFRINQNLLKVLPATLHAHPDKYKVLRALDYGIQIGLLTDMLVTTTSVVNNAHTYSAINGFTNPDNTYGDFDFPSGKIEKAVEKLQQCHGFENFSKHELLVLLQRDLEDLTADLLHDNGISADGIEIHFILSKYFVANSKIKDANSTDSALTKYLQEIHKGMLQDFVR